MHPRLCLSGAANIFRCRQQWNFGRIVTFGSIFSEYEGMMDRDLMLRRKWTLRAHDRQIVLVKRANEIVKKTLDGVKRKSPLDLLCFPGDSIDRFVVVGWHHPFEPAPEGLSNQTAVLPEERGTEQPVPREEQRFGEPEVENVEWPRHKEDSHAEQRDRSDQTRRPHNQIRHVFRRHRVPS